jgi:AraC-like DNA-binding protein
VDIGETTLSNLRVRTLFTSELVTLTRYRCTIEHPAPSEDQVQPHHVVGFPHGNAFMLHHAGRQSVVGVNAALCLNAGESYCSSHPFGSGDHGSAIVLAPAALIELLAQREPSVVEHPERPFRLTATPTAPRTYLAERMLLRLAEQHPQAVLAIEETALAVLAATLHAVPPRAAATNPARRELAAAVMDALERDLAHSLSLNALASQLGFSPFHLARVFKQEVGLPIHRWRNRLRLRIALADVGATRGGLSELAVRLGYVSHSHFTAAFRAEFGLTPTQLRRIRSTRDIARLLSA